MEQTQLLLEQPESEISQDLTPTETPIGDGQRNNEVELLNKEVITLNELLNYEVTEVPFLWANILPTYGITFITGPSDCNKSTFLRQLAFAIGRGDTEFLGLQLNTNHKKVIMVVTEDSAVNLLPLINKQLSGENTDVLRMNIRFVFPASDVHKKLTDLLKQEKADLIIVDTWTDTYKGDLNQANGVRSSLGKLKELTSKFGCAVLALHHIKKGADEKTPNKDGMIGSMGIQAFARTVIDMRRESAKSDNRLLTVVKGNYTSDEFKDHSLVLKLDEETMLLSNTNTHLIGGRLKEEGRNFTPDQKEMYMLRVRELQGDGESQDAIVETLKTEYPSMRTPSKGTLHKWLKEAVPEDVVSQEEVIRE
jgi:RecA-family ATPase